MATLYLGLRVNSKKLEKVVLNNVNLGDTVESIKKEAAKRSKTLAENISKFGFLSEIS